MIENLRFSANVADISCIGLHGIQESSYIHNVHFAAYTTGNNGLVCLGGIQGGKIYHTDCYSGPFNYEFYIDGASGTDLEVSGHTSSNNEAGNSLYYFRNLNHLRLHNFHIEGYPDQDGTGATVELYACNFAHIHDMYFGSPGARPLVYGHDSSTFELSDCTVFNNELDPGAGQLIWDDIIVGTDWVGSRRLAHLSYPAVYISRYKHDELSYRANSSIDGRDLNKSRRRVVFYGALETQSYRVEHASAAPTADPYRVGDRIVNTAPSPGEYEGWVCTTAGTAGVDAVFKGYGLIAS
jgi:hypothetical protein